MVSDYNSSVPKSFSMIYIPFEDRAYYNHVIFSS
ncbi:unnamed protein product [Spirodela intermedia]|uniref:Uncharacterized protein n=2 Tax=Spirodela intermedia TaxID=51605 RepID=A0A7I8INR3_SPIIN|nr:unnamed protein product [Spirodela intermedia]CAA6659103.1 unnamed protein product [Spirodela intermedia]CAA7395400.1 unnamed protein product [Spirodela intermedia]